MSTNKPQEPKRQDSRESFRWCGMEVRKAVTEPKTKPTEIRKWREVSK